MITIHFSPIETMPNVTIKPLGIVSDTFLSRDINTFHQAAYYIKQLPYGYNSASDNAMILFDDGFGTCITKHGVIAQLAEELDVSVYRYEGLYPLTEKIITGVDAILAEYGLPYIPRTHCFLASGKDYIDLTEGNCTGKNGLIHTYLKIYRVKPEQTQAEKIEAYHGQYTELCETDSAFSRIGVEGMLEVLKRCEALNTTICLQQQQSSR